jgi:hypothetical protein
MKKLFALFSVALLTSCFSVGDINGYWNKATIDPALEGTWNYVDEKPYDKPHTLHFTRYDDVYKVDGVLADVADTGLATNKPVDVRSLKIGKYTYALGHMENNQWLLVRYEVKGKTARELMPHKDQLVKWIRDNVPTIPKSVTLTMDSPQDIEISTLDDEAFRLLALLPDGEDYWDSFLFKKGK